MTKEEFELLPERTKDTIFEVGKAYKANNKLQKDGYYFVCSKNSSDEINLNLRKF